MATILIVDDNSVDRLLLRVILGPCGHTIVEASDAGVALELAAAQPPELLISDIVMPTMDGYALARELRANEATKDTRLMFYTAAAGEAGVRNLAEASGAMGIIPKPSEPQAVIDLVDAALREEPRPLAAPTDVFDREHLKLVNDRLFAKIEELDGANKRLERLRAELVARAEQQAAVVRMGTLALQAKDLGGLLDEAVALACRVMPVELGAVIECGGGQAPQIRASFGWPEAAPGLHELPGGAKDVAVATVTRNEVSVIQAFTTDRLFEIDSKLVDLNVTSAAGVPISGQGNPYGALVVHSTSGRMFSAEDLDFLRAVANVVGHSIWRRRSETILHRGERLESLGRLAGGIAHDFNNMLQVIVGYLGMAVGTVDDPKVRVDLEEAMDAAKKGSVLARKLLTVGRAEPDSSVVVDVAALVGDMKGILDRAVGQKVAIVVDAPAETAKIAGDPGLIEQILLNLCVNARDAMAAGGEVRVALGEVELDEEFLMAHPEAQIRPGRFVCVSVADSGSGMTDEVKNHLFEPFFTTKPPDIGTGLGLATVYGAATQLGGYVAIESELGVGTKVLVYIPAIEQEAESGGEAPQVGRTVLVVEDHTAFRGIVARNLTSAGYTVVACASPADALGELAATEASVDVLLTDIALPGMSGWRLAERARELRPTMRVMFMSGYPGDGREASIDRASIFLAKPFTNDELIDAVERAMGDRESVAS